MKLVCNFNSDGAIDVLDIVSVVNIIMEVITYDSILNKTAFFGALLFF